MFIAFFLIASGGVPPNLTIWKCQMQVSTPKEVSEFVCKKMFVDEFPDTALSSIF